VIDMLMVSAVLACPKEHGVFKGTGTEDQRQQPQDPVRLKSKVRIQPVIAKCDRESADCKIKEVTTNVVCRI